MAEPTKTPHQPKLVKVVIMQDGIFFAEDMKANKGEKIDVPEDVAALLESKGFATRVG